MSKNIYHTIRQGKADAKKAFAVLIDPDKLNEERLAQTIDIAVNAKVDYFFVGGSLVVTDTLDKMVATIKKQCSIPVILFPGSPDQITAKADALLYLSLISGRNAELLIGHHVVSAPFIRQSGLEIIPVGYMLIDGGSPTTVSYISNTNPIPSNKNDIAICTAMAGEMLGLQLIYMDAGSGAQKAIPTEMIKEVAKHISAPLIIGGGITTAEKAIENCIAGADIIVIGNAVEKNPTLIKEIADAIHSLNK
ncbi:MAG: geranylgeranylglyceryl/heptaprenylglyceryl phosphate synthase [Bacteroidetes bacterium]|nr:geranylgeranylglyceryl/heptaprenylglyceryl phosphate synthase [Bacteroidota bacterium]